jgi:hypothetical protein
MPKERGTPKQPSPRIIAEVTRMFREREAKQHEFVERYGHARPPQSIEFQGKQLFVVGGEIYRQERESEFTFLQAIHDHALRFFGVPMLESEEAKPLDHRHPALQWMYAYVKRQNEQRDNPKNRASQTGAGAE